MNDWLAFVLAVLATWRISYMIAREDGPFDIFSIIRDKVGQEKWYGRGLHCVLCISFWLSLPAALIAGMPWLIGWFGVAGAIVIIFLVFEG